MSEISSQTLWIEVQQGRYFLVPGGQSLPEGDTTLISLSGSSCRADLSKMVAWEVPESRAMAYLYANAGRYFVALRESIAQWQSQFGPVSGEEQPLDGLTEDAFLASFFPELTQIQDSDVPLVGLQRLVGQLADLIEDSISGNEERLNRAREKLRRFTARLRERSIEIQDGLDNLPDQLYLWYTSTSDPAKFTDLIVSLRAFAGQTRPAGDQAIGYQMLFDLVHGLGLLFEDSEKRRQQHYQDLARQAVQSAVGEIPQFDFKQVWARYRQQHDRSGGASPRSGDREEER